MKKIGETKMVIRFEEAVVVNSIEEEIKYIKRQRCSCGGRFDVEKCQVAHTSEDNKHYDVFFVVCSKCKREKNFVFSIDNFFGK